MTANQSRLLGVALLLSAVAGFVQLAKLNEPADGTADRKLAQDMLAKKLQVEQEYAQARARYENGAYILRNKRISDTEEVEIIVIPEGYAAELDTRCVLYKNSELKTSSLACDGIAFHQLAPPS